jgi:hypothetical protein
MKTFTVQIDEVEEKALLTEMVSIQEWIDNAIHSRAEHSIKQIATREVARMQNDPSGPPISADRRKLVVDSVVKTAAEVNAEVMAQMQTAAAER